MAKWLRAKKLVRCQQPSTQFICKAKLLAIKRATFQCWERADKLTLRCCQLALALANSSRAATLVCTIKTLTLALTKLFSMWVQALQLVRPILTWRFQMTAPSQLCASMQLSEFGNFPTTVLFLIRF